MESTTQYYPSANWATLAGSFTPKELRAIARQIEKKHKVFKEAQDGSKK